MFDFFRSKKSSSGRPVISMTLLSVVFGFAAGAVGMLVAVAYLTPEPAMLSLGGLPYQRERVVIPPREAERVASPVETAVRSLVLFYPADAVGKIADREIFLPADAVGAGMVLTSDGWLITHASVTTARGITGLADLTAVIGPRSYPVREVVRDPYSGLSFVRIEATNLPVVSFSDGADLIPGDSVFAFDAARGPRRFDVIGFSDRPLTSRSEAIRSSERMQKILRLTSDEDALPGSMLLDRQGEVVGIFVENDVIGSVAVPFRAFSGVIGSVLKDKSARRPLFGVNYLDLADNRPGAMTGVLLMSSPDGRRPAVIRQSPAAKAGLREGDVLVAINGEVVTANNALADIIAEYETDSVVRVTIRRDGEELIEEVVLGAVPAP